MTLAMFTELCKTAHARLIVGKCPWCGWPITKGHPGEVSWEAVQEMIKKLVTAEDKSNPLTDQEIVQKLAEEDVLIAVRTVSKFRKKWGIPPAKERRIGYP